MWKSVSLDKYLRCRSRLEAYIYIDDMMIKDNLGLNLYVVFATCFVVVILEN